jgi:hypothetical protein
VSHAQGKMAEQTTNRQHKKTLEDAAQTWEEFAQDREQQVKKQWPKSN